MRRCSRTEQDSRLTDWLAGCAADQQWLVAWRQCSNTDGCHDQVQRTVGRMVWRKRGRAKWMKQCHSPCCLLHERGEAAQGTKQVESQLSSCPLLSEGCPHKVSQLDPTWRQYIPLTTDICKLTCYFQVILTKKNCQISKMWFPTCKTRFKNFK